MSERKHIAILTTGRQDYGILRSTVMLMRNDARFDLRLWAGGMHLSNEHGHTIDLVRADGVNVSAEIDFLGRPADPPCDAGRMLTKLSALLKTEQPDALMLLGDRSETLAAGFAATLCRVPIVHLHGGEESEGAVDNAFRHALTKLSHLHLVSHATHAQRVLQMGEPPENVVVVGAAGLDNLYRSDLPSIEDLEARLGVTLEPPVVMVTLHPSTLGADPEAEVTALSTAMDSVPASYVISQPNSDDGGEMIRRHWERWVRGRDRVALIDAAGEKVYWGLLRAADLVVGNSSSGIIEAPSAGLPVVNVGDRQRGRLRSEHVVDVAVDAGSIGNAIRAALSMSYRERTRALPALYPSGPAAPRIVEAIARWTAPRPPCKRFHDLSGLVQ